MEEDNEFEYGFAWGFGAGAIFSFLVILAVIILRPLC